MAINFKEITDGNFVPFTSLEINSSLADQELQDQPYSCLYIGQRGLGAGEVSKEGTIFTVLNADEVEVACGKDTILHRASVKYFNANPLEPLNIYLLPTPTGSTISAAKRAVSINDFPSALSGDISLHINGSSFTVPVDNNVVSVTNTPGEEANTLIKRIEDVIGSAEGLGVSMNFDTDTNVITFTSLDYGVASREMQIISRANLTNSPNTTYKTYKFEYVGAVTDGTGNTPDNTIDGTETIKYLLSGVSRDISLTGITLAVDGSDDAVNELNKKKFIAKLVRLIHDDIDTVAGYSASVSANLLNADGSILDDTAIDSLTANDLVDDITIQISNETSLIDLSFSSEDADTSLKLGNANISEVRTYRGLEVGDYVAGNGNPLSPITKNQLEIITANKNYNLIALFTEDVGDNFKINVARDYLRDNWHSSRADDGILFEVFRNNMPTTIGDDTFDKVERINSPYISMLPLPEDFGDTTFNVLGSLIAKVFNITKRDRGVPLQNEVLDDVFTDGKSFGLSMRNEIVRKGLSAYSLSNGLFRIDALTTTSIFNDKGVKSDAYKFVNVPLILSYLRYSFVSYMGARLSGKKLVPDSVRVGAGQTNILTPRTIRSYIISLYNEDWVGEKALVESSQEFLNSIVVEIDRRNENRVNISISPNLVNQIRVVAILLNFRN